MHIRCFIEFCLHMQQAVGHCNVYIVLYILQYISEIRDFVKCRVRIRVKVSHFV